MTRSTGRWTGTPTSAGLTPGERLRAEQAAPPSPPPSSGEGGFDPAEHTVAEVLAYLREHPDQMQAVYDAELAGKARSSILVPLEAALAQEG